MASLGLIIAVCRRRARTRLVAGGTIKLRLAGCSTVWHGVFTILSLLLFAPFAESISSAESSPSAEFSPNHSSG